MNEPHASGMMQTLLTRLKGSAQSFKALPSRRHKAVRLCELLALGFALVWSVVFIVTYLSIAYSTLNYPFQLEWMEGGVIETIARVRNGQPIYQEPSLEYVSYLYTPLYFWVSSLFSYVFGVDFFAARLVSFLSIIGVGILIQRFVHREGASLSWSVVAVGVFFATYAATGQWFHMARVDSLALLLLLWPFYLLRFGMGWKSALAAGVLLSLSFLAKQSALVAYGPVLAVMLFTDTRRALVAGIVMTAICGVTVLILNTASDGWFWYYVFDVGREHPDIPTMIKGYWTGDIWRLGIAASLGGLGLTLILSHKMRPGLFYIAMTAGLLVMCWLSRIHSGGYINVLIPAYAAITIAMGIGLAKLAAHFADDERTRLGGSPVSIALAALVAFQLYQLDYGRKYAVPPEDAKTQGENFLTQIKTIPGEVLLPDHRFIQTRVGMVSHGLGMAGRDLLRIANEDDRGRKLLVASIEKALADKRFSAIILSEDRGDLLPTFSKHYHRLGPLKPGPCPLTGWRIRPGWIYVPRGRTVDSAIRALKAPPNIHPVCR
jgi:hypothetical protein